MALSDQIRDLPFSGSDTELMDSLDIANWHVKFIVERKSEKWQVYMTKYIKSTLKKRRKL